MKKISFTILIFTVSVLTAQTVTGLSNWSLYLDPGHSQKENMGIYNYSEAEKNVRASNELYDLLTTYTDIDTVYRCRTGDSEYISLYGRQDDANRVGVNWYHSLHSDAGAPGSNSTLLLYGESSQGNEDTPLGGKAMSHIMIDKLTRTLRTYTIHGAIGDCSFYGTSSGPYLAVNRRTNMTSELSEAGFHTNPVQNQRNMNAQWNRLEAWSFFWSILEYHNLPHIPSRSLTGIVSDLETGKPINGATVALSNDFLYTTDTYETLFNKYSSDPNQLANGFYYFEGILVDSVTIIISAESYYPDTLKAGINDDFHNFLDIKLISEKAPVLISSIPVNGETLHPAWDPIVLEFNRFMDTLSVTKSLNLSPEVSYHKIWNSTNNILKIFASFDYTTNYVLKIDSLATDAYGHYLNYDNGQNSEIINFKTSGEDIKAPEIVEYFTDSNEINVSLNPAFSYRFNESLDTSTFADLDNKLFLNSKPDSLIPLKMTYYDFDSTSIITLFPTIELSKSQDYTISLSEGINDIHGNSTQFKYQRRFTTIAANYTYMKILDNFDAGTGNFWEPQASGSTTGILTNNTSRESNIDVVYHSTGSLKSMKINYGWDLASSSHLIRLYAGYSSITNTNIYNTQILQSYVFGDGSGNSFRFCVKDANSTYEVSPWYNVDWYGWKLVSWDLSKGETGFWFNGDGVLNNPMTFDSFQFTYNQGSPNTGTFYFDDFRIVEASNVSAISDKQFLAEKINLSQNYPNPFNGNTKIDFQISKKYFLSLKLYNIKGALIKTLAEGDYPPGNYSVDLNSSELASGIYIYSMSIDGEVLNRRLAVLK